MGVPQTASSAIMAECRLGVMIHDLDSDEPDSLSHKYLQGCQMTQEFLSHLSVSGWSGYAGRRVMHWYES